MPIRIYALAKELKIDSKELVEICTKAGIPGKGSALASLDEDEVNKVRSFLRGPAPKPPSKPSGTTGSQPASTRATAPPKTARPEPAAPTTPATFTREDYIAPGYAGGKIKVLDARSKNAEPSHRQTKKEPADSSAARKPKRRAPVINVAPIPEATQPTAPPPVAEPKAQKPEIRLPKEALAARKGQGRPPLEHLADKKKKSDTPKHGARKAEVGGASVESGSAPRRGKKGHTVEPEKAGRGLAGLASARADRKAKRATRKPRSTRRGDEESTPRRRRTLIHRGTNTAAPRKGKASLTLPCTVRTFSEATGLGAAAVQRCLMGMGQMVTINSPIDEEFVELLAAELGVELEFKQHETLEDAVITKIRDMEDAPENLNSRPPIITFLGHVDHGKTSLLDAIIGTSIVSGEAGGITQHIRAYQIEKDGRKISFVDTPGHEAFTEMRARGAQVTDIAVLVIAADDGIMPQTEEAISHAKAAGVPIVVALNKIDIAGVDPNTTMTQMTEYEMTPSQWGGDTEVVPTSATTGQGIDELLETILTVADMQEYAANPNRAAVGTCLEAEQQGKRGVVATLIVKNGTLKVGDILVCGATHGRVKAMYDTLRRKVRVKTAGPSVPVRVTGLDTAPEAGELFYVIDDIAQARQIAARRLESSRERALSGTTIKVSFEEFQRRLSEGRLADAADVATLNLIIRADVRGSIEAIQKELSKLQHPEVQIKILQASVGGVTVADVTLAHASQAVIIGFNVIPDEAARALADDRHVEIRRYDVIYKVSDDIRALLEGKLKPEEQVVELGQALVKQVFSISRIGAIAGCYVVRGSIERGCRIRVNRDGRTIGDYPLESLRREKDDTKEVPRGMECGIKLAGFNDIKKDDVLEAYKIEEVARTL